MAKTPCGPKGGGADEEPIVTPEYALQALEELPEEALAQAFRARGGIGGSELEYQARDPDFATARLIKSGVRETVFTQGSDGRAQIPAIPEAKTSLTPQYVFGNENRWIPYDSWSNKVVFLQGWTAFPSGGEMKWCSGVYVGPRTLITAAHCVRGKGGKNYGNYLWFSAGARHGVAPSPASAYTHNRCYLWWYPSAWASSGEEDYRYDWAVIDFMDCPTATPMVGWAGMAFNHFAGTCQLTGYPQANCPGSTSAPTLCRHEGNCYQDNSWRLQTEVIDSTVGQSGGPWTVPYNGQWVIGVNSTERTFFYFPWFHEANTARYLDTGMWQFIQNYTTDF